MIIIVVKHLDKAAHLHVIKNITKDMLEIICFENILRSEIQVSKTFN